MPSLACKGGNANVAAMPAKAPAPRKMDSSASLMPLHFKYAVVSKPKDRTVKYSRERAKAGIRTPLLHTKPNCPLPCLPVLSPWTSQIQSKKPEIHDSGSKNMYILTFG